MKIYVKGSETSLPKVYNIEVIFEVDFDLSEYVAADSNIKQVRLPNGSIDQQALADYDCFADNIYIILDNYFEIVDMEFSNKSDTSRYYYLYAKNSKGEIATKYIIRLRFSDHEYTERHNKKSEKVYVDNRVQDYKRPKTKRIQEWRLKEIIVNNTLYSDYEDALDDIEAELERYSRKMFNKGN